MDLRPLKRRTQVTLDKVQTAIRRLRQRVELKQVGIAVGIAVDLLKLWEHLKM